MQSRLTAHRDRSAYAWISEQLTDGFCNHREPDTATLFIFDPAMKTRVFLSSNGTSRAWTRIVAIGIVGFACAGLGLNPARADTRGGATLAQQGGPGITACVSCHGARGEGQSATGFPRLAGQPQAYLLKQLQAFAESKRKNPLMEPIARALSAQQMRDLADYYAGLPGWPMPAKQSGTSDPPVAPGPRLATTGNWDKGIPACFACHGPDGAGIPPHFPAITGQPSAYTRTQLKAWQAGTRGNDPQGLMKSVADRMTDADIDAVSRYLENPAATGRRE
ncbi:MAG: c-type cytochrome [Thiobacillus sp.]|nr:c-type cytochrome [Thiobacillus sp.]